MVQGYGFGVRGSGVEVGTRLWNLGLGNRFAACGLGLNVWVVGLPSVSHFAVPTT